MKNDLVTFDSMSLESLTVACQSAFEDVEDVFQIVEKNRNRLEYFGKLLTAAKAKVPHGEWEDWITDTFQGRLKIRTASRWMSESNRPDLADLRREKDRARIAGRVKVATPPDDPDDVGTVDDYPPGDFDVDSTPDPPTIRKTAAGTQKVKESDKPKTRAIVPEIVEEDCVEAADRTERVITAFVIQCDVERFLELKAKAGHVWNAKSEAKHLRKLADKLDPPTKFVKPDLEEVSAYFAEQMAQDPDSFFDFYESKGWLVGKVSMRCWRASARKWIRENQHNGKVNGNNGHLSREQQREQNNANSIGYLVKLKREQEQRRLAGGD